GRGLAGAAQRVPAGRLAAETLVHVDRTGTGGAHGDVGHAAVAADHAPDAVLVRGPPEDDRLAAAAGQRVRPVVAVDQLVRRPAVGVVPYRVGGVTVAAGVQVEAGPADGGHQRIASRPGRHLVGVVA